MNGAVLKEWENGSREINPSLRDDLILEYAPLIKYVAQRMAVRLPPHIELDDLVNAGTIGLIDAIEKFDSKRGVKFRTYAEFRVRGAMLDELRSLDWFPRSLRKKIHQLEEAYETVEKRVGRPASEEEVAEMLGVDVEEFYKILHQANGVSLISLEDLGYTPDKKGTEDILDYYVGDYTDDPSLHLRIKEIEEIVGEAINLLPEKQRLVITLYYYEELTMKEIGKVLGITESRVSQIRTEAMLHLKGKLKRTIGD